MMKLVNALMAASGSVLTGDEVVKTAYDTFSKYFKIIMPTLIAVVLVIGMVYAIIIGVQFAKAEDTDQRDKAKNRLINVIIGVVVAAVLMIIIWAVVPLIMNGNLFGV